MTKWFEQLIKIMDILIKDKSKEIKYWNELANEKGKWGLTAQFKNELWFQSELLFKLNKLREKEDKSFSIITEFSKKQDGKKSWFDYDFFIVEDKSDDLLTNVQIKKALDSGVGVHLKSLATSAFPFTEVQDAICKDVKKARWKREGFSHPPCIGICLFKKDFLKGSFSEEWDKWREPKQYEDMNCEGVKFDISVNEKLKLVRLAWLIQ